MVENIKFKHLFSHVNILTIQSSLYLEVTCETKKVVFKASKRVSIHMKFSMTRHKKLTF